MIRRIIRWGALSVFLLLLGLVALEYAFATPVSYNSDAINWNFQTVTNPIMLDTNEDGFIDNIYSANSLVGPSITLTRVFGSGTTPISITLPDSANVITTNKNFIWFGTGTCGATITARGHAVNISTGSFEQNAITRTWAHGDGTATTESRFIAWNGTGTSERVFGVCKIPGNANAAYAFLGNNTANIVNIGSWSRYVVSQPFVITKDQLGGTFNTFYNNGTITSSQRIYPFSGAGPSEQYYVPLGHCKYDNSSTNCYTNTSGSFIVSPLINSTAITPPTMRYVVSGFEPAIGNNFNFPRPTDWKSLFDDTLTRTNQTAVLYTHPAIFGQSTNEQNPVKFLMYDGSQYYVGLILANSVKYTSVMPSGYAVQSYIVDSNGKTLTNLATTTTLTYQRFAVQTPTSSIQADYAGRFISWSGYDPYTPGVSRSFNPSWTNDDTNKPIFINPYTGLTQLSITVRNNPPDFALDLRDTTTLNGQAYSWTVKELQADDSITVDIPTNTCFTVFGRDISTTMSIWNNLGQLCASGSSSKTITYTTNLSFTFWTLPWGVSSVYDPQTDGLVTMVRNSEINYTYNLRVYDRNGTLSLQQQYTNQNGLSTQSFNITGIQTPATLQILDQDNSTLYHTTMGYGNWLTAFQTFSNQHLTIDGFNLVAMMPLIFAAMWTRNTVSMGTMMTVVMIATLGFFGVLAIPEVLLYLMVFIAAIGMVAYKLMY